MNSTTAFLKGSEITVVVFAFLPFICFDEVHVLCTNTQEGGCLLHGVVALGMREAQKKKSTCN